jgi:cytochrome c biogenesis protein CcmG/thiol:disulfide interchange protein DsbE
MRCRSLVGALLVVVLLSVTGCTQTPSVGARQPTTVEAQPTVGPLTGDERERLAAAKKAAGIADCPGSDAAVRPVPGGLPDVELTCLGGGRAVHLAGLRGRPLLVNVWAQWCGPCRAEAPYLKEVSRENRSTALVLGIDFVDPQPGLAIEFAQASGWRYPQLADTDKLIAAPLQVLGPPYTFFVRANGTIAYKHAGAFTSTGQIRQLARQHLGVEL